MQHKVKFTIKFCYDQNNKICEWKSDFPFEQEKTKFPIFNVDILAFVNKNHNLVVMKIFENLHWFLIL